MTESNVRFPDDTSNAGKRARKLQITVQNDDGTVAVVHQSVVTLADSQGNPINLDLAAALAELSSKTDTTNRLLARIANVPVGSI